MNTNYRTGKRAKIRLVSFLTAIFAALIVWGITQTVKTNQYKEQIAIANQRSVSSLASYLNTMETDLQKMQYANTSTMTSSLALSLCKATSGAKTSLSELSSGGTQLSTVNKFLSQASDYVQALNKKIANGQNLTDDDHKNLTTLYEYAADLSRQIAYMEEVMYAGTLDFEDTVSTLGMLSDLGDLSLSYADSVSDAEDTFSDYPTLLYDGPFSDQLLEKESDMLKKEADISEQEALKRAAEFSGIEESRLIRQEDENGHLKAYVYYCDGTSVAVSQKGGYLVYLLAETTAGEAKINEETAIEKAREYLEKFGYVSMKDSYYSDNDGICTVNFAYTQDDVIYYSDLIKVSVALDTGKIISVDASGYLMNHKSREIPSDTIGENKAAESISSVLTVKSCRTAMIPMDDGNEIYTYEFFCSDKSGNDVLVYINAETGKEADIKLLLYSDGGTLTR